jgi:uncharacterized protein (TIGR03437 family)
MKIRGSLALKLCLFLVAAASIAAASTPPALSASPSAVDFAYSSGEQQPLPVNVAISASDGSSPVITVILNPPTGIAATLFPAPVVQGDTIQVGFDDNTLNQLLSHPAIYTASLTVEAPGFANLTIPIAFSVGGTLAIIPAPTSLSFTAPNGVTTQTVTLEGTGFAPVSFTLSSVGNWMTVTTDSGSTTAHLTVTVNPLNLTAGTYQGSITVTPAFGAPLIIPVTLQVGSNTLSASPTAFTFSYTAAGTTPPPQVLALSSLLPKNTYTAQGASSGNWLLLNGGTTELSGSLPANLNVTVNPAGLAAGTYTGTITATDADGSMQVATVTLLVTALSGLANPTALTFVSQQGGPAPEPQTVSVVGAENTQYLATVDVPWLSVSSASGPTPVQLTVYANPGSLVPATYTGTVSIELGSHTQRISVTFEVSATPVLTPSVGDFMVSYYGGTAVPAPMTLDVGVSSGAPQKFIYAPGLPSWLQISSIETSLTTPAILTVTVLPQTLPTGTYQADIILIPSAGDSVIVPVLLQVAGATPVLANPTSLAFSAAAGGGPQSQTIGVTAASSLSYTASATITGTGPDWLSVSPTSGTANGTSTPLTVTADATGLSGGTYVGNIALTTTGGVVTDIPVTFTVGSGPFTVSPSTLTFAYFQNGAAAPPQNLQVTGGQSFTTSVSTNSGGKWLVVTPTSGTGTTTLSVSLNTAGLPTGTYAGSITVTPAGGTAQTVAVTLIVSPPALVTVTPNPLAFSYATGNPPPAAQSLSVTAAGAAVTFTASASSAGWLSVTPTGGTTPATLSVAVNPANLGAGSYTGSITVSANGNPQANIPVTFLVTTLPPSIDHVANAASFLTGGVAPGEIVSVFGSYLGPAQAVYPTIANGLIATNLAGVQVMFNGYPGPILYASAGQINTIVPYELAGASNVSINVVFGKTQSNAVMLPVVSASPGIFSADASGQGPGAILDLHYQLVSSSNPASAGSIIQVFATGQGQTSPPGVDGLIEPLSLPLPAPLLYAGATIANVPATIQYVGAAPGLVAGALQVNIVVPEGVPSGLAPLFISFGGVDNSQTGILVAIQ